MKRMLLGLMGLVLIVVVVPAGLVGLIHHGGSSPNERLVTSGMTVHVYMTKERQVVGMSLEEYVRGVVAAEMPIDFRLQALEAQAIAARTNVVRKLSEHDHTTDGADVTDDFKQDQAFTTVGALKSKWGSKFDANMAKLNQAVNKTAGQILVYEDQPIDAMFFSTSNGFTESNQDVFGKDLPYLQSVPSPWDAQLAPRYHGTKEMSLSTFADKLHLDAVPAMATADSFIKILAESPTHRAEKVEVGDKVFNGNDFRLALGLNSTSFTWNMDGGTIIFYTTGYGHGVGLSQYGADALAAQGKTAEQIVTYYYRGAKIGSVQQILAANTRLHPQNL